MDSGERKCQPLRAQLLSDLDQHVGAVGVSQVDGLGIDDDASRRFLLSDELMQAFAEPVGVREEQRPVDARDDDARDRLQAFVARDVVVGARRRVAVQASDVRTRGALDEHQEREGRRR